MNLIIAGGRDFDDYYRLDKNLTWLLQNVDRTTLAIFSGQAKGADRLGEIWATRNGITVRQFPADWDKHGKKAGILRNQEMLDAGASHLVAFWDEKSRGTFDMISRAKKVGIHVRVVKYKTLTPILEFQGPTRWLSNFALCNIWLDGVLYPSTENAYQAAKTSSWEERLYFLDCTPAQAKKQGGLVTMRPNWNEVKVGVMTDLTRQKFKQEPYKSQLLATGNCKLVEGNVWGDTFWGVCKGVGENNLGKIIMAVREELTCGY